MNAREMIEQAAEDLGLVLEYGVEIKPGDLYLAARNTGPHLLTCKYVHHDNYVVPVENAYPFDTCDCVKVTSVGCGERR